MFAHGLLLNLSASKCMLLDFIVLDMKCTSVLLNSITETKPSD